MQEINNLDNNKHLQEETRVRSNTNRHNFNQSRRTKMRGKRYARTSYMEDAEQIIARRHISQTCPLMSTDAADFIQHGSA